MSNLIVGIGTFIPVQPLRDAEFGLVLLLKRAAMSCFPLSKSSAGDVAQSQQLQQILGLWCREKPADTSLGVVLCLTTLAISMFPCLHLLIPLETAANIEK